MTAKKKETCHLVRTKGNLNMLTELRKPRRVKLKNTANRHPKRRKKISCSIVGSNLTLLLRFRSMICSWTARMTRAYHLFSSSWAFATSMMATKICRTTHRALHSPMCRRTNPRLAKIKLWKSSKAKVNLWWTLKCQKETICRTLARLSSRAVLTWTEEKRVWARTSRCLVVTTMWNWSASLRSTLSAKSNRSSFPRFQPTMTPKECYHRSLHLHNERKVMVQSPLVRNETRIWFRTSTSIAE